MPATTADGARATAPLLEARGVSKAFPGVQALSDVTLEVRPREVVGFIGENGAGKSTLLNVLSGVERPDAGEVRIGGEPVSLSDPHDANRRGVFRIYQELALVPNLPVYENLFLSHEQHFTKAGVLGRRAMRRRAGEALEAFGHGHIDPAREVGTLDFSTRQVVEIIKAFALADLLEVRTPVILLDEPTAGLSNEEIGFFSELVRDVRERSGVVFVSHRLSELLDLSDRIYVIKDGVVVTETTPAEVSEAELHHLMVGRERDESFYQEPDQREAGGRVLLRASGLSAPPAFRDVDLELREGEVLGVAGVLGSGKSELGRALFGARAASGTVEVDGRAVGHRDIATMIEAGVGYVSPERHRDGIVLSFPVAWNVSLTRTATSPRPLVDLGQEQRDARDYVDRLRIKTPSVDTVARTLSGGNQQKVILAKWLVEGVRVLVLDNPTRGIDAGAKEDVYALLRRLAQDGVGILLISDDLLELIGLSNRVLVMRDGVVAEEIATAVGAKPGEAELVAHMV